MRDGQNHFLQRWMIFIYCLFACFLVGLNSCSQNTMVAHCQVNLDCIDSNYICVSGRCVEANCHPEKSCEAGMVCVDGLCYPKNCTTRICPGKGEVCVEEQCTPENCVDVTCPQEHTCANGKCYPKDCETILCKGYGEVCADSECQQRSCVGVECPENQRCANGYCYPTTCDQVQCPDWQVCDLGECVDKNCAGVECPELFICANGTCWPQDCTTIDCEEGQVCENEVCVDTRCVEGQCYCENELGCDPGQTCLHNFCCSPFGPTETLCNDGQDNDCDDLTDCLDTDCEGLSCNDGLFCTVNDSCTSGSCGGEVRDCSSLADECNNGICDTVCDSCQADPVQNNTPCSTGACQDGICSCIQQTYYRDADGDGYGNATNTTLSCAPAPSGYVANNTDCYDNNKNAFPGSTYCGTTNRGDGSFDYNCVNGATSCGTIFYNLTNVTYTSCNGASCVQGGEADCIGGGVGCGASGYAAGGHVSVKVCKNCGGSNSGCTGIGSSGVQGCQ